MNFTAHTQLLGITRLPTATIGQSWAPAEPVTYNSLQEDEEDAYVQPRNAQIF